MRIMYGILITIGVSLIIMIDWFIPNIITRITLSVLLGLLTLYIIGELGIEIRKNKKMSSGTKKVMKGLTITVFISTLLLSYLFY